MNEVFVQLNDVAVNVSHILGADIMDEGPDTPITHVYVNGFNHPIEVEMSLFEVLKAIREAQDAIRV